MKHIATLAIFLLLSLSAATSAVAQKPYESIGPGGKIVYSDRPPAQGQAKKAASSPTGTATSAVVLYTAVWCGHYCKKAKAYLADKGITYQEIDIDTNDGGIAFAQAGGDEGVPFLVVGNKGLQGFSDAGYDELFANRK